ncbi:MAG: hypothetical protein KBE71_03565 [Laribacter sp.]|nr:hypothetical protein [Laribacter sp.]MBP9527425.1 hypothetical protein [Laribacter sp.]
MIWEQSLYISQVCPDLDIGGTAVRRWIAQYEAEQQGLPKVGLPLTAERQRIRALEAEVRRSHEDDEILKKTSAFFTRQL